MANEFDIFEDDLTDNPTLSSVAKIIGEEKAVQLSKDFGGRRIYIASNPGAHSVVVASIGIEAARSLASVYSNMQMQVPITLGRQRKIIDLLEDGRFSVAQIAHKANCSERNVYLIKAKMKTKDSDLPLFD